ncbi:MAG: crosslink repair DNA glycosylase YcaQ family protein, partial [Actinomycetota bacterium]
RLGTYDMDRLDQWLNDSGENFEYWAHAAAVLPIDRYPLWRWKMQTMKPWRRAEELLNAHPGLLDNVLRQVADHGPLTVRDLDAPDHTNEAWWGYGPGKVALEVLFANGHVTALRTGNFTRLYDIPQRSIPPELLDDGASLDRDAAYERLLIDATRHHGIGTATDIIDYFRLHGSTARPILERLAREGTIEHVDVSGWEGPVYLDPQAVRPRSINGSALLSPFDPVMWNRERAERMFGFRYRIEIYVPKDQRVYGYYVLPFMLDGDVVGRVDLKADRNAGRLLVRSAFIEEGKDATAVAAALAAELHSFGDWIGMDEIVVEDRGNLASRLAARM